MTINHQNLLHEKAYLSRIESIDSSQYKLIFELRTGYQIPLILTFSPVFPTELPIIHINKAVHSIPDIPHVMRSGLICFLDEEGVIWSDIPEKTIDFVFERVENVLISNPPQEEYHREFSYYFGSLENAEFVLSVYPPADEPEEISVFTIGKKAFAFLNSDMESKTLLGRLFSTNIHSRSLEKAYYIPLDKTFEGAVPQLDRFWSNKEISKIIRTHINDEKLSDIQKFSMNKSKHYYLIRIPLLNGEQTVIGLKYEKINQSLSKRVIPLIDEGITDDFKVTPYFVFRNDDSTLLQRGGGVKRSLNTLLIGCGSVGSDLLFILARSGIKEFTLVDDDELKIENSYRHFLGMNKSIGRNTKVELLKEEFEKRYPNVKIQISAKEAIRTINTGKVDLNEYDLILVAIGNPNIERKINRLISKSSTPAIFTWVEAYGLGGHALVLNNGDQGCYECLIDNELRMYSSFAGESDVPFTKNMNGCAGSFTPYGSIDSMETALLASRLVMRFLEGDVKGNPLVSWKGSSEIFRSEGFHTSQRYNNSIDSLKQDNYEYINPTCDVCADNADVVYYP
ncbi:ThiF family adenylyltransferase [Guptibacillus hwajinpoensis]|uniref:ThiF family adenylyltransferase n=1 Tax=Guptibacillus hwajinpoensis TaxID=208199 RepID=UPI003D0698A0